MFLALAIPAGLIAGLAALPHRLRRTPRWPTPAATGRWPPPRCWWWPSSWWCSKRAPWLKGFAAALSRLHHRSRPTSRPWADRAVEHQLRDGRRRAGGDRPQCRSAATGSGPALRPSTARSVVRSPVGFTPHGVSDTLEPPSPGGRQSPAPVNSDGPVDKPNVGVGYARWGPGGGYGPEWCTTSRCVPAVRAGPGPYPGDGQQLRRDDTVAAKATSAWYFRLPPRTPDRPLVTVAAAKAIWFLPRRRATSTWPVAETAVGCTAPTAATRRSSEVQPIDIFSQ